MRRSVASQIEYWATLGLALEHKGLSTLEARAAIENYEAAIASQQAALVVSNHVSWVDILVLQTAMPVVFVAKSEIRDWPVLGWMVALAAQW